MSLLQASWLAGWSDGDLPDAAAIPMLHYGIIEKAAGKEYRLCHSSRWSGFNADPQQPLVLAEAYYLSVEALMDASLKGGEDSDSNSSVFTDEQRPLLLQVLPFFCLLGSDDAFHEDPLWRQSISYTYTNFGRY